MKQYYDFKIEKIKDLSSDEIKLRKKNLDLFYQTGFPNKKDEDWKFSDLNSILIKNFNNITNNDCLPKEKNLKLIEEFEHNFISLYNGRLMSSDFAHEEKTEAPEKVFENVVGQDSLSRFDLPKKKKGRKKQRPKKKNNNFKKNA